MRSTVLAFADGMRPLLVLLLAACGDTAPEVMPGAIDAAVDAALLPDAAGPRFTEDFGGGDQAGWPAGWNVLGGVAGSRVVAGRGELMPVLSAYSLARMGRPMGAVDADVSFDARFGDVATQGVGFYVRQNGGYLQSATHGEGYAVFLEGFRGARLGVWRERDGVEQELLVVPLPGGLANDVTYHLRFVCQTEGSVTRLAARVWTGDAEPTTWTVETTDATPALQGIAGGVAIDHYTTRGAGSTAQPLTVDAIVVR